MPTRPRGEEASVDSGCAAREYRRSSVHVRQGRSQRIPRRDVPLRVSRRRRAVGTSVYELPPGQSICPYHYEYAEEEWLVVLVGKPTLRHPDGADQLVPWDVVCFPRGPAGAHQVRNDTEETVRVLMYSTVKHPAATVYPDSDKIAVWTGNRDDDLIVHRSSGVDYWSGEPTQ